MMTKIEGDFGMNDLEVNDREEGEGFWLTIHSSTLMEFLRRIEGRDEFGKALIEKREVEVEVKTSEMKWERDWLRGGEILVGIEEKIERVKAIEMRRAEKMTADEAMMKIYLECENGRSESDD